MEDVVTRTEGVFSISSAAGEPLSGASPDRCGSAVGAPDVSVVIVGTNEKDLIRRCLDSLSGTEQGIAFEVVVVDNCSTDGTAKMISERFPSVRVVSNRKRYPRSANNNIGMAAARGGYLLLLDPDTVVRPDALRTMHAFLQAHPEAGAVGAQLIGEDGAYQLSARTMQTPAVILARRTPLGRTQWGREVLRHHLMEDWKHDTVREVEWLQGAALMIPRPVFDMVGGNDPALIRYVEDMDWCFRAHKLGWRIYYCPDARIEHLYRRASAARRPSLKTLKTAFYHLKGWNRFYWKHYVYFRLKRGIDLLGASLGLLLAAPFIALLAVAIRIESRGTVFFSQTRIGLNGRPFSLYKFRSMCDGAATMQASLREMNEVEGPVFKIKNDPRLTAMGRFMRRFSLDEVPQLMNILLGHMSLVGPRPPLPWEVEEYTAKEFRRLGVTPGLTGLWQVNGRSDIPFEKWVDLDIRYIAEQSLWLDIKILVKTVPAVLSGKGAY